MPNLFAHYTLGERALGAMTSSELHLAKAAANPFILGLQGPDVFFYGSILRDRLATDFGSRLHTFSGRALLEKFCSAGALSTPVRAYLMGFVGHFTLDVLAHPYVGEVQEDEATHLALESDFDIYLLAKAGIKPWKNKLYKLCPKDLGTQAALAEAYAPWHEEISPERVSASVRDLHNIRRLMRTPNQLKFSLIRKIMEAKGIYTKLYGMLIPPPRAGKGVPQQQPEVPGPVELPVLWPGKPADSLQRLEGLLADALPIYCENLLALDRYLDEGVPLPAFFDHDFSGEIVGGSGDPVAADPVAADT